MQSLDALIDGAARSSKRIVMSEGEDDRIIEGSVRAVHDGIARIVLLGDKTRISEKLAKAGAPASGIDIVDPATAPEFERYSGVFRDLRAHKGVDLPAARTAMASHLRFAAMMVRQGQADGTIGGARATTADTVLAALQIIGPAPGVRTVSSFFLMMLCEPHHVTKGVLVFADCGLIVEPTVEELCDIAISSATSFRVLVGQEPRVAMLSFSTAGSAKHARVSHVSDATKRVRALQPDMIIDGELQFDAAFVPEVSASKSATSPLKGQANVMVFPNLEAGNIGYKIAQRIGGAKAIGPILQGLAKPANDLSRGCSADEVYHMIAVTSVQASASQ